MISKEKSSERKERARKIATTLETLFPERSGTVLNHSNTLELLFAVILSAQCTDAKVNEVTKDLFRKYRSVEDYARVSRRELERDIRPTGFYKTKARYLQESAKIIIKEFNGEVPDTMDQLLTLPGVARKTANVVLGNAYQKFEGIPVDTHVRRFAIKFDLTDSKNPDVIERDLMQLLPKKKWFSFANNLIFYGREICPARRHDCTEHPLTRIYPKAAENWPKSR